MRIRTTLPALFVATVTAAAAPPREARADVVPIDIAARGQNRLVMDGVLGDWRRFASFVALDEAAQVTTGAPAWSGADDASLQFAFARDDQSLYFAAEVRDDRVVRSREHRAGEDALVISLAVPGANGRLVAYDVAVYPGEPGSYVGAVRFRGARSGAIAAAQVVEAPLRSGPGFTVEVAIPWRAMPEILAGIGSLRGRVAYHDADGAARTDSVLASGPGDGEHASELPAGAGVVVAASPADLIARFRAAQNIDEGAALLDRTANVAGDAALERVVVYPRHIVAAGPGIAGGSRYAYVQFPMQTNDDLVEASARDVTGDGRIEILVRVRVPDRSGMVRQMLYVFGSPNNGDSLERIFAHELGRAQGSNSLTNRATYESGGRIRVSADAAAGYTAQNYPRAEEPGVPAPLTPWGPHRVVVYRWNEGAQRFDVERQEPNPNAAAGNAQGQVAGGAAAVAGDVQAPGGMRVAPTDVNAVLRLFRQQRGVAENARPNHEATANVSGDATPETVQIYGSHLVVVGPRFMNGRSYYSVELPTTGDNDVMSLEMADVTDDGRAEAVVRVRRQSQVQARGQTLDLVKEFLFAYSLDDTHRGRVFGAEVVRRVGSNAVVNTVRPLPRGRNAELVIESGRAVGWTQQTYPFRDTPAQGFAPILLPWEPTRRVVYRWNGTALAPVP